MADSSGCVFCRIVTAAEPAHVVFRDEMATAFLDSRPLFPGHVLLVPNNHHETIVDLPADEVGALFGRARRLAGLMEDTLGAEGSFVAVNNRVSQSVPHLHIHVVPRRRRDGLRGFFWPRNSYDDDEHARAVAAGLAAAWEAATPAT